MTTDLYLFSFIFAYLAFTKRSIDVFSALTGYIRGADRAGAPSQRVLVVRPVSLYRTWQRPALEQVWSAWRFTSHSSIDIGWSCTFDRECNCRTR
jgi:hypothetical protein